MISAGSALDYHQEYVDEIKELIGRFASLEETFGPSTALMKYGADYRPSPRKPGWLIMGAKKNCFNNATALALIRDDVFYAEGYALDADLPFAVQHAWVIDAAGQAIDPTWDDADTSVYYGMAFSREFVRDMLDKNDGGAGVLVSLHDLRRRHRGPGELEAALFNGMLTPV